MNVRLCDRCPDELPDYFWDDAEEQWRAYRRVFCKRTWEYISEDDFPPSYCPFVLEYTYLIEEDENVSE